MTKVEIDEFQLERLKLESQHFKQLREKTKEVDTLLDRLGSIGTEIWATGYAIGYEAGRNAESSFRRESSGADTGDGTTGE